MSDELPTSPRARATSDENFPVASLLIAAAAPRADHGLLPLRARRPTTSPTTRPLTPEAKLARSSGCAPPWSARATTTPAALALRQALAERGLGADHALDLLEAFRRDVTKLRYADWDELMDYCRYSAMPVGRFVLDVHGEARATWPASDALCAALQVINHLQDCAKDYRELDRVYLSAGRPGRDGHQRRGAGASRAGRRRCGR